MANIDMPDPHMLGPAADAWRVPINPSRRRATVAHWLVRHPQAHPFWSRWVAVVIHLREVPGCDPPVRRFPTASHEFWILSIDPATYDNHAAIIRGDELADFAILSPPDAVIQFEVANDALALAILETAVRGICDGRMSPDQDYRAHWKEWIARHANEYRSGRHGLA